MAKAFEDAFDDNDFIIRVTPKLDKVGAWNGDIRLSVVTTNANDMDDDDFDNVLQLCNYMCVAVQVAEENEQVRTAIWEYVQKEDDSDEAVTVQRVEDNVVYAAFTKAKESSVE